MKMKYEEFIKRVKEKINAGDILKNPKKGTSKIMRYTNKDNQESIKIVYKKPNSKIYVSLKDLYNSFNGKGGKVTSTDLKEGNPHIFDSSKGGHSCNCSFLFMILEKIGIINKIEGKGVKGDPFFIKL